MSEPDQRTDLAELLSQLERRGDEPAIIAFAEEGQRVCSSRRLATRARQFRRGLHHQGLAAGDRVALIAENSVALITACLGTMASGCVAVPLDVQMETKMLGHVLQDAGVKQLLTTSRQAQRLSDVIPESVEAIFLLDSSTPSDSSNSHDRSNRSIGVPHSEAQHSDTPCSKTQHREEESSQPRSASDRFRDWHELLGGHGDPERNVEDGDHDNGDHDNGDHEEVAEAVGTASKSAGDEVAVLFYTSGTTGPPKGVPLTHRHLITQIDTVRNAKLTQPGDRVLLPLPLHHVYPFVIGLLTPLSLGLPVILPRSLTGPDILKALREGEATMIIGVPRLYRALSEAIESQAENFAGTIGRRTLTSLLTLSTWFRKSLHLRLGRVLFRLLRRRIGPNLRVLASGGSPLDPELGWRLEGLGWQVAIGYGLTETSPLLTMNPPGAGHLETVGRPIRDVELRIDEHWQEQMTQAADEAEEVDREAVPERPNSAVEGEILARGPSVFHGYWNLPDKTDQAFNPDGWFRTGDLGFLDQQDRLHVTGRVSTLMITEQGEKVQPDELESAYAEAAEIREIGVLQQDKKLVGLVVPETRQTDSDADVEEQVREAVRRVSDRLPSYQRLADIALTRKSLPRTRIGKIRRHRLQDRWQEAQQEDGEPSRPLPREEMSPEDRELLGYPAAEQTWDLLAKQFSDQPLTPDASLRIDLGVDSMQWLNLTMQIMQKTGVELDDATLERVDSVRDLLEAVRDATGGETHADLLEDPDQLLNEQQRRRLQPLGRVGAFVARNGFRVNRWLVRWFLQLKVEGREHLPEAGPLVIAVNHLSNLDASVLSAAMDSQRLEQTYWAAWVEATRRNPLTRIGSRFAKTVPIDPKRGVISSLAVGAAVLRRNRILVWFPEGQRSRSGELQPFKQGLGILLQRYPVPVVPARIWGTYEAMPPGKRLPRPHATTVRFGAPMQPEELERSGKGDEPAERIVDALHDAIAALDDDGGAASK